MGSSNVGIAGNYVAENCYRLFQFPFLQVSKTDVQTRRVVRGSDSEYLFELSDARLRATRVDQHDAEIVARIDVGGVKFDGALIGIHRTQGIAGFLQYQ